MKVLVTGASGQLGQALQFIAPQYTVMEFVFAGSDEGDICNALQLKVLFDKHRPDFCINTAAYTAVDKAESEPDAAQRINVNGTANLAQICKDYGTTLIHISTDFVFDGSKNTPYTEEDITNPQSVYGMTKRDGETAIIKILEQYYIVRTSWVYSQFGNNFMKTMLRVAQDRDSLSVVNDQIGTPTNAVDLADAILKIIVSGKKEYGIYNFSNEGETSWYGFAKKIFEVNNITIDLKPIPTSAYPTPATRPSYSVLSKQKIKEVFVGLDIKPWDEQIKPQQ